MMSSPQNKPELLLPAGSPEKLRYAVAYGADAVYLGLPMASLRTPSRGTQFTPDNLASHVRYAQQRGVSVYVTINIFPSNRDLVRIRPHLEQLEDIRPDAIIFTDPGVYRLAVKYAPSVPLHLSTQANTLNVDACAFWQDLGVARVILAREVPCRDIAEIHARLPDLSLECFVHGSLCVAYSGRCVISDYLTDNTKNSNKGMCGNSCRWEFQEAHSDTALNTLHMVEATRPNAVYAFEEDDKGSYMLNSKDLCLIRRLRELRDAGIDCFKVEGRTKSVYYVATAGRIYREALDALQHGGAISEERFAHWIAELAQAGNRGFTEGFFDGRPNRHAYNYEDSRSHQTARFLASVADATESPESASFNPAIPPDSLPDTLTFQARNPFQVGDPVDWITPQGVVSLALTELYDAGGFPVKTVQTNHRVTIPVPPDLRYQSPEALQWSLLRTQVRSPERVAVVS